MTRSWEAIWDSSYAVEETSRAIAVVRVRPVTSACAADRVRHAKSTWSDIDTLRPCPVVALASCDGVLLIPK